jgi:hypothetical protein
MRIGIDADRMIRRIHGDAAGLRHSKPGRQKRKQSNDKSKTERRTQNHREPPEAILPATKILDQCSHHAKTLHPYCGAHQLKSSSRLCVLHCSILNAGF